VRGPLVERADQQGGLALLDDPVEGQRFERGDLAGGEGALRPVGLQVLDGGLRPFLQDDAGLLEADDLLQVLDRHREDVVQLQVLGDLQGDAVGHRLAGQLVAQAVRCRRAADGDRQPGGQHVQRLERFRRHAPAIRRITRQQPAHPLRSILQRNDQQTVGLPGSRARRAQDCAILGSQVLDEDGPPARGPALELRGQIRRHGDRAGVGRQPVVGLQGKRHDLPAQAAQVLHGTVEQSVEIVVRGVVRHSVASRS